MKPTATVIDLPYPPSVNRLHGLRKGGRGKYLLPEVLAWRRDAGWLLKQQRPGKIPGPYRFKLLARRPDNRRRDADNLIKETLDLCVSLGVVPDDSKAIIDGAEFSEAIPDGCRVILTPVEGY